MITERDLDSATVSETGIGVFLIDGREWIMPKAVVTHPAWSDTERVEAQAVFDAFAIRAAVRGYTDRFCIERGPGELRPTDDPKSFVWVPLPALSADEWRAIEARVTKLACPAHLLELLADRIAEAPHVVG